MFLTNEAWMLNILIQFIQNLHFIFNCWCLYSWIHWEYIENHLCRWNLQPIIFSIRFLLRYCFISIMTDFTRYLQTTHLSFNFALIIYFFFIVFEEVTILLYGNNSNSNILLLWIHFLRFEVLLVQFVMYIKVYIVIFYQKIETSQLL